MKILLVYDIRENLWGGPGNRQNEELVTELFTASEANAILHAIKSLGHSVEIVDGAESFRDRIEVYRQADFVFNEAKGLFGPDRKMLVPALCRVYQIPYLGSDAYTVTLARNKWHTAAIAQALGLRLPASRLALTADDPAVGEWHLFPAIVKPNHESSSIGVSSDSVVASPAQLQAQVRHVSTTYTQPVIIEQFVPGIEVQLSVVGNNDSLLVKPVRLYVDGQEDDKNFFVTKDCWRSNKVYFRRIDLASLSPEVEAATRQIYKALGILDYGRIDFRISDNGECYFIEAATHPHLIPKSSFAEAIGGDELSFSEVLGLVLEKSFRRQGLR